MPRVSRPSRRPSRCRTTRVMRSSRTCRSSTRSASSTDPSRPAWSTWPIALVRSACSSGRRTLRRRRNTSDGGSRRGHGPCIRAAGHRHDRRAGRRRPRGVARRPLRAPARILDEYLEIKRADPSFEPSRPVVAANVRPQATGIVVPLITDPGTTRCMDLLNVAYEVSCSSCRGTSPTRTNRRSSSRSWPMSRSA